MSITSIQEARRATTSDAAAERSARRRVRSAGRSRRADAGALAEMARLLLRDAREAHASEAQARQGVGASPYRAVRRELAATSGRFSARPLATRRA
jgi:hypothetical protein